MLWLHSVSWNLNQLLLLLLLFWRSLFELFLSLRDFQWLNEIYWISYGQTETLFGSPCWPSRPTQYVDNFQEKKSNSLMPCTVCCTAVLLHSFWFTKSQSVLSAIICNSNSALSLFETINFHFLFTFSVYMYVCVFVFTVKH